MSGYVSFLKHGHEIPTNAVSDSVVTDASVASKFDSKEHHDCAVVAGVAICGTNSGVIYALDVFDANTARPIEQHGLDLGDLAKPRIG